MSKTRTKKQISLILLGILGLSVTWATSSVLMFSPADNPAPATVNLFKLILSGENTEIQWKLNANKTLEIGNGRPGKNSVGSGISMIGGIGNRNRSAPDGGSAIVASRVSRIASWAKLSVIGASEKSTLNASASASVILWSSGVVVPGERNVVLASEGIKLSGSAITALATNSDAASTVKGMGLMLVGGPITTPSSNLSGTFAFNGNSSKLSMSTSHAFLIQNVANGVMVGTSARAENPTQIPLKVDGAIRVGKGNGDNKNSIVVKESADKKYACLCLNVNNVPGASITKTQECENLCKSGSPNVNGSCGVAARGYERNVLDGFPVSEEEACTIGTMTGYKVNPATTNNAGKPLPGGVATWKCLGAASGTTASFTATRAACQEDETYNATMDLCVPNVPVCGDNATTYDKSATQWKNDSEEGFCKVGTTNPTPDFFSSDSCNKCAAHGFPYCFDVSFDPTSPACTQPKNKIIWECKNQTKTVQCEATRVACTGTVPANAELIVDDDKDLKVDTEITLVEANTTSKKCEYICKSGYVYKNGKCELPPAPTYKCTGSIPENSEPFPGDTAELSVDTPIRLTNSNTYRKCEYRCIDGYENKNGKCEPKNEAVYEWKCKVNQCKSKTGGELSCDDWTGYNGTRCYEIANDSQYKACIADCRAKQPSGICDKYKGDSSCTSDERCMIDPVSRYLDPRKTLEGLPVCYNSTTKEVVSNVNCSGTKPQCGAWVLQLTTQCGLNSAYEGPYKQENEAICKGFNTKVSCEQSTRNYRRIKMSGLIHCNGDPIEPGSCEITLDSPSSCQDSNGTVVQHIWEKVTCRLPRLCTWGSSSGLEVAQP